MIDSHCHLDHEPLFDNLDEIILRSKNIGINKLLTISTTIESFNKIKKLVIKDKIIYGTYGIHPHETDTNIVDKNDIITNVKNNKKIIGIGETGLDLFYNHSNKDRQIKSFKDHIEASIELNIPIIIHSRNAENETYDTLNLYKKNKLKILMHCFTGTHEFSKKLSTFNAFFSASGIITFKNSLDLQETFKKLPLDKLLVETDSPFLAPVPMRGKKNEPSFIKYTIDKLALLRNMTSEKISNQTTNNFNRLFFNK
jgi:TatD DNase family protein|tara:strand:+ start:209 stop:973 length:765 start_codon:yes stop_codon:yes gene_type:complete